VFTYNAWRALGRQVRRGEHGVKVVTFVATDRREAPADDESTDGESKAAKRKGGGRRPWTATVFHLSQTDPIPA
jgi:antirestriction protein ArdC